EIIRVNDIYENEGEPRGIVPVSAPNSLMIRDWYGANEYVEFSDFNVTDYTDVEFSIHYASESNNSNGEFWIQYAYNGGAWSAGIKLINANVNQDFGAGVFTLQM